MPVVNYTAVRPVLACLVVLLTTAFPVAASAGTFKVRSCGASTSSSPAAWKFVAGNATVLEAGDSCASSVSDTDGHVEFAGSYWLRDRINGPSQASPLGRAAQLELSAPPSAAIVSLSYDRRLQSIDQGWEIHLQDQRGALLGDDCVVLLAFECANGLRGNVVLNALPAGVTKLLLGVDCVGDSPCLAGSGPLYDFAIAIYSSEVTIEENVAPSVGAVTTSGAAPGGWFGPDGQLHVSGADTLGIRRFEVLQGDAVVGTIQRACVDWSVLPCSEPAAGLTTNAAASIKLRDLSVEPGGERQLRVRAVDAAGNTATSAPITVGYDTTPRQPWNFSGAGLSSAANRTVKWDVLGLGAPVVSAVAHICTGPQPAQMTNCRDLALGSEPSVSLSLADGEHATVRITTTDAAGNTADSEVVALSRDATAPDTPAIALTGSDGATRTVSVSGESGSRITAQLCVVGGACSDVVASAAPETLKIALPSPGNYDLTVRLTDAAGNTSAPATLRLTRSAPLAEPKSIELRVRVTSNLRKRRISVSGSVAAGSTNKITVALVARTRRGRQITKRTTISVPASGRFAKRLRLPSAATSKRVVRITLTPTPNQGWRDTRYTHTIRP